MRKRKMMIVVMLLFYHKIDQILEEVKGRKIKPYAEKTARLEEAFTTLLPMVLRLRVMNISLMNYKVSKEMLKGT